MSIRLSIVSIDAQFIAADPDFSVVVLAPWRVHDLRRTVRTEMAGLGVQEAVCEAVLNHVKRGMARVYNLHQYRDEKARALSRWAQRLTTTVNRILGGSTHEEEGP